MVVVVVVALVLLVTGPVIVLVDAEIVRHDAITKSK